MQKIYHLLYTNFYNKAHFVQVLPKAHFNYFVYLSTFIRPRSGLWVRISIRNMFYSWCDSGWWRYQLMDPIGQGGNACDATWWVKPQKVWYVVANSLANCKYEWYLPSRGWWKGVLSVLGRGGWGGCVWGMEVYREGRWATPARPWKTLSTHYTHTKSSSSHDLSFLFPNLILLTKLPSDELSKLSMIFASSLSLSNC